MLIGSIIGGTKHILPIIDSVLPSYSDRFAIMLLLLYRKNGKTHKVHAESFGEIN